MNVDTESLECHLTDEEFAELLIGAMSAPVQDHLKGCGDCSAEAECVSVAIGDFAQQSYLWAERHTASWPSPSAEQRQTASWRIFVQPQVLVAAALAVVIALGGVISVHRRQPEQAVAVLQLQKASQSNLQIAAAQQGVSSTKPVVPASSLANYPPPSQLRADNELLSAIDGELSAGSTPTVLYGLDASSHDVLARAPQREAN